MRKKMWKKKLNKKQGKQLIYNMHNNEFFLNENEKNIVFFFFTNQGCQMLNIPTWILAQNKSARGRITNTTTNNSNNNKE